MANKGRSRLAPGKLRKDAVEQRRRQTIGQHHEKQQARQQQAAGGGQAPNMAHTRTERPMTGSQRRAANRANKAAAKIQGAFKRFKFKKNLNSVRAELQQARAGELSPRLTDLVGDFYEKEGLVTKGTNTVAKDAGRLTTGWSANLDKSILNENIASGLRGGDQAETTHHTVSDNVLGYVHAGVKAVGGDEEQRFRTQVQQDSVFSRDQKVIERERTKKAQGKANQYDKLVDDAQKSEIFQMHQNLTYGPDTNKIDNDPGSGFDASFDRTAGKDGLDADWDKRSTNIRPVHNLGVLLKSGQYGLTQQGVDHLTGSLQKSRQAHSDQMQGQTLQTKRIATTTSPNPNYNPSGPRGKTNPPVLVTKTTVRDPVPQTIPNHGVNSGHFSPTTTGPGTVRKKGFKA